jgi:outer membrane protein assembly factor BamB
VYVGSTDSYLYALDGATGALLWQVYTGPVWAPPLIGTDGSGAVHVGVNRPPLGAIYAINGSSGAELWSYRPFGAVQSLAIAADGTLYAAVETGVSTTRRVTALNGTSGAWIWSFFCDGAPYAPALGADGVLYAGTSSGTLHALNGSTGQQLWNYSTGQALTASPSIGADGTLVVGGNGVYAFNDDVPSASTTPAPWGTHVETVAATATAGALGALLLLYVAMLAVAKWRQRRPGSAPAADSHHVKEGLGSANAKHAFVTRELDVNPCYMLLAPSVDDAKVETAVSGRAMREATCRPARCAL